MALYEESKTIVCPLLLLYPNCWEGTTMSRHIDKEALVAAVMSSTELDNEQKSQLIRLIREQKKYGLVWEDSTEDAWEKMKTSIPVLNEVDDKRILNDKDGEHYPNHAIIEADNLHALIALTYTHAGMIDVIYIDPPYNTGNKDFAYYDDFEDEYRQIPYVDREDSYRHSKWLSFMAQRLQIAKTLLSEKGVIFISIDDNEQANLKLLCDEIFGESNNVGNMCRSTGTTTGQDANKIGSSFDYCLIYRKSESFILHGVSLSEKDLKRFKDSDDRGTYSTLQLRKTGNADRKEDRPNMFYAVIAPDGTEVYPFGPSNYLSRWRVAKSSFEKLLHDKMIVWKHDKSVSSIIVDGYSKSQWIPYVKYYAEGRTKQVSNLLQDIEGNKKASLQIKEIFGDKGVFEYPKPVEFITTLLTIGGDKESLILDFFAGSGTTLHATMQLNAEDGGHRQCILVTNNENNICEEVTYERNKRVIEGYTTPKGEQVAGLSHNNLRYYKLDFNPRMQSHQSNRELFYGLKDLLCIKENIYQEQQQFGSLSLVGKEQMLRYFAENGREMLMVYDTRVIPFIVNEIAQRDEQEQSLKIYIFADGAYPYTDDFASVIEKVSLIPMPYAYYRGIKDSLPEETTTKVDDTELTDEEQQTMMAEAIAFESKE